MWITCGRIVKIYNSYAQNIWLYVPFLIEFTKRDFHHAKCTRKRRCDELLSSGRTTLRGFAVCANGQSLPGNAGVYAPVAPGAGFPSCRAAPAAGDERKPAKASLTARRLFADRPLSLAETGRLRGVRGHPPAQAGGGQGPRADGPVCLQAGSSIREPPGFRVISAGAPLLAGIAGKVVRARGILLRRFVKGGQLPETEPRPPLQGLNSAQGASMEGRVDRSRRFQVHGAWPAPRGVRSVVSAARYGGFPGPTYLTPLPLPKSIPGRPPRHQRPVVEIERHCRVVGAVAAAALIPTARTNASDDGTAKRDP